MHLQIELLSLTRGNNLGRAFWGDESTSAMFGCCSSEVVPKWNTHCLFNTSSLIMMEAVSLGLMEVYLMDKCSLLLWRRSVRSTPPAPVSVFSLLHHSLSLFLPLVWFTDKSRAANARLLLPAQRLKINQHINYSPSAKSIVYTLN